MPKTMATRSTTNVMSSTWRVRRKASPSSTLFVPARRPPPSGGIDGSRATTARATRKVSASSP
jgi:hypothetical protein